MEKIEYGGWDNCYRLANEALELVLTADVGPRIIRLAVPGEDNMFKEFSETLGETGGKEWLPYGGHRLWHAPEVAPRTYHPDNDPIRVEPLSGGLRAIQPVESSTGIEKQIDISVNSSGPHVKLTHRLINHNLWPVKLSAWALSVMAPGGEAIVPQPPYQSHEERLTPSRPLVLWPYTRMDDDRWQWGGEFIRLRQDPGASTPQKIGVGLEEGRAYYALGDCLFMKRYKHKKGAEYPDFGCSFETFTNGDMLEVESLSPLEELSPGGSIEHVEHWFVFKGIELKGDDKAIAGVLQNVNERSDELMGPGL